MAAMDFDLENPFTLFPHLSSDADDSVTSLFLNESDHMPSPTYLLDSDDYISIRRDTISLISQCCGSFDPFLSYLAINYLDRFLSTQGLPQPKPWILRLLAISCVSLAAKMKKTHFSLTGFQGNGGFMFDTQTIRRMEVIILGALEWRMRSITPFSFISFFIPFFKLKDPPLMKALKARAFEIIFKAPHEVELLEYKPSIIAASALLSASHELFPMQYPCFKKAISSCSFVNKESMSLCFNAMQDVVINGYKSVFDMVSSSDTPVNVLDHHFSSSESENTIGQDDKYQ